MSVEYKRAALRQRVSDLLHRLPVAEGGESVIMACEWNYISEIDGKSRTCFRCEVCGDGYSSIGDAEECEREHREAVDDETSQKWRRQEIA